MSKLWLLLYWKIYFLFATRGKEMTIVEAEKRCEELNKQIFDIRQEYDFGSYARYCGDIKMKPLNEELYKLVVAIGKAKETTKIGI